MKLIGKFFLIVSFFINISQIAEAQTCPFSSLITLTNGTTADANAVVANFNAILNCLNTAGTSLDGAFINEFPNGTMDVWRRGTSSMTVTASGAYTAEGWFVQPAGVSVTVGAASGLDYTVNSLQITGATGVTDVTLKQPIESYISAALRTARPLF